MDSINGLTLISIREYRWKDRVEPMTIPIIELGSRHQRESVIRMMNEPPLDNLNMLFEAGRATLENPEQISPLLEFPVVQEMASIPRDSFNPIQVDDSSSTEE